MSRIEPCYVARKPVLISRTCPSIVSHPRSLRLTATMNADDEHLSSIWSWGKTSLESGPLGVLLPVGLYGK
jgi:hypothetical protein